MRGVISGQLIISMVASLLFLVMYGHPGRYEDREMAWFLAALVWAGVLLDGLLLAAVFGARIPLWVAVGVLAGQDIVVGWRLWLLLRAHADRRPAMWTVKFWKQAGERAAKTFAQGLLGVAGTGATGLLDVGWKQALSVAGLMALLSLLTSVASTGTGEPDSPSLVDE